MNVLLLVSFTICSINYAAGFSTLAPSFSSSSHSRLQRREHTIVSSTTTNNVGEAETPTTATTTTIRPDLLEQMGNEPDSKFMINDTDRPFGESSSFPIPSDELIALAKAFTAAQLNGSAADWFANDFRFVAPVVGPFDKDEFIDSLSSFDLKTAFPTLSSNYHHWRVCPFEPNRVWYSIKYTGSNDGPVMGRPATFKSIESPVQTHSICFNERGEVTKFTIGYVMDKETGNTGGLGGVFGLFYAIGYGLPFPEAQPWRPSPLYGTLMKSNRLFQDFFKANPQGKELFQKVVTTLGGGGGEK